MAGTDPVDYRELGLLAGIEIHQQLDTKEKLFCRCPTVLREFDERNGEFSRYLRATESELGEIDRAAQEEMKNLRLFKYYTYDTTCLVENDEEPPAPLNREALGIGLTIAKTFGMTPVEQVHTMRKLVIDGSNTSGFQRTALAAMNGMMGESCNIETICIEEEAAQRVEDGVVFSLDRLGIPLVEITTGPCMKTPEEVKEGAAYIGMVLRSTGRVKRGLGTIRQDVNISIREGARVEIKGVQDLDLIDEVVRREARRQQNLLAIREELKDRGASVSEEIVDVTSLFKDSGSSIIKRAKCVLAVRLNGFAGLVGREIQPGRRLGSEISDYAKKCGVGGLFHTDELPAYGVTAEEVQALKGALKADENDCVILIGDTKKKAECAVRLVIERAKMAFEGVPKETRKMLEEGSTSYLRPLPGAARMYPETDVMPVEITKGFWDSLEIPELLTDKAERYAKEMKLDPALARQIAFSEQLPVFDEAVSAGIKPTLAARTLLGTIRELRRDGVDTGRVTDADIIAILKTVEDGNAAKEAIPDLIRTVAGGKSVDDAISSLAPAISTEEMAEFVMATLKEREDFVREKGMAALGPIMGIVMKEYRGSVDGKVISDTVKKCLVEFLG